MDYEASPAKHNTELQFLRVFDEAVILPVGNATEDYFTVNFFPPNCLGECHLPSGSKIFFYQIIITMPSHNNNNN